MLTIISPISMFTQEVFVEKPLTYWCTLFQKNCTKSHSGDLLKSDGIIDCLLSIFTPAEWSMAADKS